MNHMTLPALPIPTTTLSPSPAPSTAPTGRPTLWNASNLRKMCRLYTYTTLKIEEIIAVVHRHHLAESMPGKDSANKKLSALLDKEPRWLKPRDFEDMQRRCGQLSLSPIRSSAAVSRRLLPAFTRVHSHSAPPPICRRVGTPIKYELDASSATAETPVSPEFWTAPESPSSSTSAWPPIQNPFGGVPGGHERSFSDPFADPEAFPRVPRRGSDLSNSTDETSSSIERVLEGYDEAYTRMVRQLVRSYTAPNGRRRQASALQFADETAVNSSWVTDPDVSPAFNTRPFPLPADFIIIDTYAQRQNPCFVQSEEHQRRWCVCHAADTEFHDLLWATASGPTPWAVELLTVGPQPTHAQLRDVYGNTTLHFLASRAPLHMLFQAIQMTEYSQLLDVRNSAGQTFLHALGSHWFSDLGSLMQLLEILATEVSPTGTRFDVAARDCYGRTFFHMILAAEISCDALYMRLQCYPCPGHYQRDAFGLVPVPVSDDMQSGPFRMSWTHNDPNAIRDSRLIEIVRLAATDPGLQDEDGRNGLHCLAMVSLSPTSLMGKINPISQNMPKTQKRRTRGSEESLDSSESRLRLRHSVLTGLLDAGVDPNHYDAHGNTPLMAFSAELPEDDDYKTGPQIIETLLERGANIHARNRSGETALHIAARCGRKLAIRVLIDRGANVHARDASGRSVLALTDVKMERCSRDSLVPVDYCHYEACRAYLSGRGHAVQEPTVVQEWAFRQDYPEA